MSFSPSRSSDGIPESTGLYPAPFLCSTDVWSPDSVAALDYYLGQQEPQADGVAVSIGVSGMPAVFGHAINADHFYIIGSQAAVTTGALRRATLVQGRGGWDSYDEAMTAGLSPAEKTLYQAERTASSALRGSFNETQRGVMIREKSFHVFIGDIGIETRGLSYQLGAGAVTLVNFAGAAEHNSASPKHSRRNLKTEVLDTLKTAKRLSKDAVIIDSSRTAESAFRIVSVCTLPDYTPAV